MRFDLVADEVTVRPASFYISPMASQSMCPSSNCTECKFLLLSVFHPFCRLIWQPCSLPHNSDTLKCNTWRQLQRCFSVFFFLSSLLFFSLLFALSRSIGFLFPVSSIPCSLTLYFFFFQPLCPLFAAICYNILSVSALVFILFFFLFFFTGENIFVSIWVTEWTTLCVLCCMRLSIFIPARAPSSHYHPAHIHRTGFCRNCVWRARRRHQPVKQSVSQFNSAQLFNKVSSFSFFCFLSFCLLLPSFLYFSFLFFSQFCFAL